MPRNRRLARSTAVLLLTAAAVACTPKGKDVERPPAKAAFKAQAPAPSPRVALPADLRELVGQTFTGDLDQMVQRRLIRVGVPYNRTYYFIDKGTQRGLAYEYLTMFEDQLNRTLPPDHLHVYVVLLPMARDVFLPALRAGKIDMAVAQLTVTPERQRLVDFSTPTRNKVAEVLVTGPGAPPIQGLQDLQGTKVFVRKSSSYYASLLAYDQAQQSAGRPLVQIEPAPETLEDDDLLEMVNAGLVPATVVDDFLAHFWNKVFASIQVHDDIALRTGASQAVAFRKDSPKLAAAIDGFIAKYGLDSALGAVLRAKYLQATQFVQDAASDEDRRKFLSMVDLFRKYGDQYSFDYLLVAAQGYQESRLNQNAKSPVGAIGVMQLTPTTGASLEVGDIHRLDPNIHAGVKYMRALRSRYFDKEPMTALNKGLFTFAAYNAGAGRIASLRREAAQHGLDPDVWFGNVERVASERIGRETVTYVSNIYKYYLAYRLIAEQGQQRSAAKTALAAQARN